MTSGRSEDTVSQELSRSDDGGAEPSALATACTNPDHDLYPYYGVAPHECFYKKGPNHSIGQSTLLPRSEWPDSFVLDLEPGEAPETVAYPSACGVFYCPECRAGMPLPPPPEGVK